MPTRDDAWKLLCEYTNSESLRKHALAVEACLRAYARKSNADEECGALPALVHDFDYERWPNDAHAADQEHPFEGSQNSPGARLSRRNDSRDPGARRLLSSAASIAAG